MYQDAFSQFCNAEGSCTSSQVGPILRTFGQNPAEAEIQDMVNQVDKDGSGMLDFPEFLMMMALKADFENGNGYINRGELSSVMMNLGIELDAEEIQSMI